MTKTSVPKTVTTTDMHGNHHQARVDQLVWRPSAYGVIIHAGNILLIKYGDSHHLPGGGVDLGELAEPAVIREVFEETGITVANPKILTSTMNFYTWEDLDTGIPEHYQSILMYYRCDYVSGKFSKAGHESHEQALKLEPVWLPLGELDHIKIGSSVNWLALIKPLL